MGLDQFEKMLKSTFRMDEQAVNFAKVDLPKCGLATYHPHPLTGLPGYWQLLPWGLEIARYGRKIKEEKRREEMLKRGLLGGPANSKGLIKEAAIDLGKSPPDKNRKKK